MIIGLLVAVVVAAGAAVVVLVSSDGKLTTDPTALAKVSLPVGGGTIQSVSVVTGPQNRPVPVQLRGDRIWPRGSIPANEHLTILVAIKRPGSIGWLTGSTERLRLSLVAPVASLRRHYITLGASAPLKLHFKQPIAAISYGPTSAQLTRRVLGSPSTVFTIPRSAQAGSVWVAAVPRSWERSRPSVVSWFPAGAATAAVATPAPGSKIGTASAISLTFSKPVSAALGTSRPPISPTTAGSWTQTGTHTIVFHPTGYGYGLGATVKIGLPSGASLVGGQGSVGTWTVPAGSTLRLQQLLANLGYLPLRFNYAGGGRPAATPQAQEAAAIHPPAGSFTWHYGNVPGSLRSMWAPGTSGEMTKGAVMAFENDQGMTADGVAGPTVWKALLGAAIAGHGSTFGYTYVQVSEGSPESIAVWHSGKTVVTGPVNTGIPSAPTVQGTFAVFEHALSVTMSGTNPDGSHYSDAGVPYVSYFNGGDALHGFLRASYGSAQSLGCVEMPYSEAASVYPYTPIGTLVNVA